MPASASDHPLVSVVLPVYNRGRYVAEAIRSILAQTFSPLELIVVVDEGSNDDSANIVRYLAAGDTRIRPLFLSHGSQWRARNRGIEMARGEYIAHMDDDDIALPDRIAAQLAWMRRTGVDACGGCTKKFGTEEELLWFPETHQAICHELLFRIAVFLPTLIVRTEIARAHPYDEALVYSDYAQLTMLAPRHRLGNLPQIVLKSRFHSDQIHMAQHKGFTDDWRAYRQPYFRTLFLNATPADAATFARVADRESHATVTDLQRAGEWLVRLGQTPDNFLRRRMANRWQAACQRSAHLGLACYQVYQQYAPQFEIVLPRRARLRLWLKCAMRVQARSQTRIAPIDYRR